MYADRNPWEAPLLIQNQRGVNRKLVKCPAVESTAMQYAYPGGGQRLRQIQLVHNLLKVKVYPQIHPHFSECLPASTLCYFAACHVSKKTQGRQWTCLRCHRASILPWSIGIHDKGFIHEVLALDKGL